jgi:hypothetical protein
MLEARHGAKSRRKKHGAKSRRKKYGAKSRRKWRKSHLAVDAARCVIVARTLTDQDADDPSQVAPLLDRIDDPIGQVTADGAYDGAPTYQTIAQHDDGIEVVVPPRSTSIPSGEPGPPTQRERHVVMIAEQGRLAWQAATDYGRRCLVETTMGRYKALIGPRLRARDFAGQQTEAAIGAAGCWRPDARIPSVANRSSDSLLGLGVISARTGQGHQRPCPVESIAPESGQAPIRVSRTFQMRFPCHPTSGCLHRMLHRATIRTNDP